MFAISQISQTQMKSKLVAGQIKLIYDSWYKNKPVYKLSLEAELTMILSNRKLSEVKKSIINKALPEKHN